MFHEFDQIVLNALDSDPRPNRAKTAIRALETFINLAEKTGRLVPNLRAQMFVWGEKNDESFHMIGQDYNEEFAELLAGNGQAVTDEHRAGAEALISFALDLAGGAGMYPWTITEQRELLRKHVALMLAAF